MDLLQQLQRALEATCTIERELAGGGMSRVFVAVEKGFGRRIVIKVLPPDAAASVSGERFKREVAVAARLQHPHIVPLLSAGEAAGTSYYTMPYVQGETLRTRLTREGELSLSEAVHILRDIAAALAHAHGEGVVHRDIKPENVILSGGVAVVTDFGVAKAVDTSRTLGEGESALTTFGVALGTPGYMSPEQASADPHVDHRADIYSFGCVAYEMLTGTAPFAGRSPQQILAAHVNEVPAPMRSRRTNVSLPLALLVDRCLQKRAADRPQSAAEMLQALDVIATPSGGYAPSAAVWRGIPRRWMAWGAGTLAVVIAGLLWLLPGGGSPLAVAGSTTRVTSTPEIELDAAISPDGKFIAYAGGPVGAMRIYVRQLGGGRILSLSGELGGDHRWPRWSPDGSRMVFQASGGLYLVPAFGGRIERFAQGEGSALLTPSWSPDGTRLAFTDERGLWTQALSGGSPVSLATGSTLHSPAWSPDGKHIAYVSGNALYIGSALTPFGNLAPSAIWLLAVDGGAPRSLTDSARLHASPVFTPDGRSLLFVSNASGTRDVYQVRLSSSGRAVGAPHQLTVGLQPYTISLSADGRQLGYSVLQIRANIWTATMRSDPATTVASATPVTAFNNAIEGVDLSRDGQWLAFDSDASGNQDIYKMPTNGGDPVQLSTNTADEFVPRWSPDDKFVAYHSLQNGTRDIYIIDAEGRNAQRVTSAPSQEYVPDWSPDGQRLCFSSDVDGAYETYTVARRGGGSSEWTKLSNDRAFRRGQCRWSPDGKFIANVYGGRLALLDPAGSGARTLVDWSGRADEIRSGAWGADASTVYFHTVALGARHAFWSVGVNGGPPKLLARFDQPRHHVRRTDFATDGKRLFFVVAADESDVWVMTLRE